ncbi:hypothetical protein LINPERHAP2_LOCUS18488, partial [Linum perenne]
HTTGKWPLPVFRVSGLPRSTPIKARGLHLTDRTAAAHSCWWFLPWPTQGRTRGIAPYEQRPINDGILPSVKDRTYPGPYA